MSDNRIIVLAILIIGISFFYANLSGVTGEYNRVSPMERGIENAAQRFRAGGETKCVVGRISCNYGGSGAGGIANRYGDVVKCVGTSYGGTTWQYMTSCNRANQCTETSTGARCRLAYNSENN